MKNYFVLTIIFLFFACITSGCTKHEANKDYNVAKTFKNFDNKKASKILQEYILQENPEFDSIYTNFPLSKNTYAVFYDLNDDGVNEVIGYNNSFGIFGGTAGNSLFILEKQKNNTYKNIAWVNFYNEAGIKILKSKTNNYHDLKMNIRINKKCQNLPYSIIEYTITYQKGYYADYKIRD